MQVVEHMPSKHEALSLALSKKDKRVIPVLRRVFLELSSKCDVFLNWKEKLSALWVASTLYHCTLLLNT
jgi:hypothetical protein